MLQNMGRSLSLAVQRAEAGSSQPPQQQSSSLLPGRNVVLNVPRAAAQGAGAESPELAPIRTSSRPVWVTQTRAGQPPPHTVPPSAMAGRVTTGRRSKHTVHDPNVKKTDPTEYFNVAIQACWEAGKPLVGAHIMVHYEQGRLKQGLPATTGHRCWFTEHPDWLIAAWTAAGVRVTRDLKMQYKTLGNY